MLPIIRHVRINARGDTDPMRKVRTDAQRAAVLAVVDSPDFWYAFPSLGFSEGVGDYTGSFFFGWFTKDRVFHHGRIARRGRWLYQTTSTDITPLDLVTCDEP